MRDISHRVLLATFVVTLVVVGGSVFLILAHLDMGLSLLTGFASTTGTVNLTVAQSTAITLTMNKVEFGSCNSSGSSRFEINTTATTAFLGCGPAGPLTIRNDGNSVINITLNGSTAADFIGGTGPEFRYNATNNEEGACPQVNLTTNTSVGAAYTMVCNSTGFANTADEVNISFFLSIPADAPFTYKLANITLTSFSL